MMQNVGLLNGLEKLIIDEHFLLNKNFIMTKQIIKIFKKYLTRDPENVQLLEIINSLRNLKEIQYHRSIADKQKEKYNMSTKDPDLLKDSILIEMDYKQKIVYGASARAVSEEYYLQKQASFLGIGIRYVEDNKVKLFNIDVISDCKEQDANAVIRALTHVRKQSLFKEKFDSIKKFIIWTDCGKIFEELLMNVHC
jgi:hypothetical protein